MSFDLNGIPNQKPTIREAQNMQNNGGGGNLGYMQQGRKRKDDKKEETFLFSNDKEDSFTRSDEEIKPAEEESPKSLKDFFKDLIHKNQEPENK